MAQQQQQQQTWLFVATYFDPLPRLKRQYLLKYWPGSHFVEMTDVKTKKLFLKKSPAPPELSEKDMMIGSKILLYSRELEIVDYGDGYTRSTLQFQAQGTIFILPPETYTSWGKVVDSVLSSNFTLVRVKTVFMAQNIADSVCVALEQNMRLSASLSSGVSLILHVTGEDGIARGAALATSMSGPKSGGTILACTSGQQVSAITEILLDNRAVTNSSTLDSCTCCIIKPHAIKSQLFGKILDEIISQGYEVSAIQSVYFDRAASEVRGKTKTKKHFFSLFYSFLICSISLEKTNFIKLIHKITLSFTVLKTYDCITITFAPHPTPLHPPSKCIY